MNEENIFIKKHTLSSLLWLIENHSQVSVILDPFSYLQNPEISTFSSNDIKTKCYLSEIYPVPPSIFQNRYHEIEEVQTKETLKTLILIPYSKRMEIITRLKNGDYRYISEVLDKTPEFNYTSFILELIHQEGDEVLFKQVIGNLDFSLSSTGFVDLLISSIITKNLHLLGIFLSNWNKKFDSKQYLPFLNQIGKLQSLRGFNYFSTFYIIVCMSPKNLRKTVEKSEWKHLLSYDLYKEHPSFEKICETRMEMINSLD